MPGGTEKGEGRTNNEKGPGMRLRRNEENSPKFDLMTLFFSMACKHGYGTSKKKKRKKQNLNPTRFRSKRDETDANCWGGRGEMSFFWLRRKIYDVTK